MKRIAKTGGSRIPHRPFPRDYPDLVFNRGQVYDVNDDVAEVLLRTNEYEEQSTPSDPDNTPPETTTEEE